MSLLSINNLHLQISVIFLSSNDSKGKRRRSMGRKKKVPSPHHLSGDTVGHPLSGSGGSPLAARSRGLSPATIGNRKEHYVSPLKSITRENMDECLELLKRFFKYFGLAFLKGKTAIFFQERNTVFHPILASIVNQLSNY